VGRGGASVHRAAVVAGASPSSFNLTENGEFVSCLQSLHAPVILPQPEWNWREEALHARVQRVDRRSPPRALWWLRRSRAVHTKPARASIKRAQ